MLKQPKMQDYYRYLRKQGYRHTTAITCTIMRFSPDEPIAGRRMKYFSKIWNTRG